MASKFKKTDKKKFKESFNKKNLKMIKELAKESYPVSEADIEKLQKASKE